MVVDTHCGLSLIGCMEKKDDSIVTVRFNDVDEFIEELTARPPNLDKVLRVTRQYEHSSKLPIQNVSVIATALRNLAGVGLMRIKLSCYLGQRHAVGSDETSKHIENKGDDIMAKLEEAAKKLDLIVGAGVIE